MPASIAGQCTWPVGSEKAFSEVTPELTDPQGMSKSWPEDIKACVPSRRKKRYGKKQRYDRVACVFIHPVNIY